MKNAFILLLALPLSIACGDKSDDSDSGWESADGGGEGTTDGDDEPSTTGADDDTNTTGGDDDTGTTGGDDDTGGTTGGDDDTSTTGGDDDTGTTGGDDDTGTTDGDDDTGTTGGDDDEDDAIRVGDELVIELPSNASTGYAWSIREPTASDIVAFESVTYVMDDAPEGMSGVGGTEVFRFRATGAGTTTIRLEYVRSWEPDDSADTHTQDVTVIE